MCQWESSNHRPKSTENKKPAVEGIALIIGIDRLLDMMRTAVNITGDSTVSIIVAKSEKSFKEKIFLSKE